MHDVVEGPQGGRPLERAASAQGQRQQGGEREHVARRGQGPPLRLLGGHERGRADHPTGVSEFGVLLDRPGDPEVDHPHAVLGEQDVPRLEVAVDQPRPVDLHQGRRQSDRQPVHGVRGQRAAGLHRVRQRRADHEHRGQPGRHRLHVGVHHGRRVGAGHPAGGGDLAPEPGPERVIGGEPFMYLLDRHQPPVRARTQQHPAHPAAAELGQDPVRTDLGRIGLPTRPHRGSRGSRRTRCARGAGHLNAGVVADMSGDAPFTVTYFANSTADAASALVVSSHCPFG